MEIKIKKTEIEKISEGLEYLLEGKYLVQIPELSRLQREEIESGKKFPFYKIILNDGNIWYVGYFNRSYPNISPKLVRHYSRNKPRNYGPTSITIKCNRTIIIPGSVFVCI